MQKRFFGSTYSILSPEPEVAAMIHLNLICSSISVFKRVQDCSNHLSYLRERDVSFMKVGLKITFPVISPEPEVAAMIHSNLIYGHIIAFERAQNCPNRLSHLRESSEKPDF